MTECRFCDSSAPLEVVGGRLVCPCCARPADVPEDASPAAQDAVGEAIDLDALRKVRASDGRFLKGAPGPNLRHGLRSRTLMDLPDLARAHGERVQAIERDLGGASELTAAQRALVCELGRLQLVAAALGDKVLGDGPLTSKGRARASVGLWLSVLDRTQRLSQVLGLERRAKPAGTLADYLASRGPS